MKMKRSSKILFMSLSLIVVSAFFMFSSISSQIDIMNSRNEADNKALDVSIIQLIANPADFDGKIVRVIGVGNIEFEGNGVYLGKDDWRYVSKNGLWIELGERATPYELTKTYNGKYVIIEGTFDMHNNGHFGMWSGAIVDITRYELWER